MPADELEAERERYMDNAGGHSMACESKAKDERQPELDIPQVDVNLPFADLMAH